MRYGVGILIALAAAILLAVTNPGPQDFQTYIKTQSSQSSSGDWLRQVAQAFGLERPDLASTRRDYVLFSVYTVQRDDETRRFLGVFKQFIPLQ